MSFRTVIFAALTVASALPAAAQEVGGMPLRGPMSQLEQIEQLRPGCPLSKTSVTVGVNKALGAHGQAQQNLLTANAGGCRPLVSTQVVAGVNLGLGPASSAGQNIQTYGPRGLLATTTYTHGYNLAAGPRSAAQQQLLNQIGR
ncbi:MAG TPA: hypothetical protein VJ779_15030 [Acetobacteraceae bacterium]|nr:hypothetical protein [Acetobacteraceae bacterium]